jgi:DNA replication protein DnaC
MSVCAICDGVGLVRVVNPAGKWISRACDCQEMEREQRRLAAAHIPERYRHCSLDSYVTDFRGEYGMSAFKNRHATDKPKADPSLRDALMMSKKFVEEYLTDSEHKGLLFTGTIGVGKTHLAVGVLRRLVEDKKVKGLFCDYRELLKSIQNSYNSQVQTTELELLKPVFAAEVLVLDDLGAQKPTEWAWDTVGLILNTRYNDKQRTIITTNYPNKLAGGGGKTDAERAASEFTLGDRIGDRMRSRLAEMCIPIEIIGDDFRTLIKGKQPR